MRERLAPRALCASPSATSPVASDLREHARRSRAGSHTTATRAWFFAADAHHRRAADVDVLDDLLVRERPDSPRLLERVEVHDDQIDRAAADAREVLGSSVAARSRMPPWTRGWSVFTRPSMTSGEPV